MTEKVKLFAALLHMVGQEPKLFPPTPSKNIWKRPDTKINKNPWRHRIFPCFPDFEIQVAAYGMKRGVGRFSARAVKNELSTYAGRQNRGLLRLRAYAVENRQLKKLVYAMLDA